MSNHPPRLLLAVLLTGAASVGFAQSHPTLDAVRLHRPEATRLVDQELQACRISRCADLSRLALLAGFLHLSEGDAHTARTLLALAPPPAELAAHHAFYAGQAAFYAQDPEAAALAFVAALPTAPASLLPRLRARAAEALIAAGRHADALVHLDPAIAERASPELIFQRAQARAVTGDKKGRGEDLRRLAVGWPSHPYGQAALAQLPAADPKPLTFDERLTRANLLLDDAPREALVEVALIRKRRLAKSRTDLAKVALVAQRAHAALGELELADKERKRTTRGPAELAGEGAYLWARWALRAHDNGEARTRMAQVAKRYPRTPAAREAGFYVGWLSFQLGEFERAAAELDAYASARENRRSHRRDEALWYRALAFIRLERWSDARAALTTIATEYGGSSLLPQALYWAARTEQLEGTAADVVAAYTRIVALFPNSFYAALSTQRLRELKAPAPVAFPQLPVDVPGATPPELATAVALSRTGLFDDADREIGEQISGVRRPDAALRLGHALRGIGEVAPAYRLAQRALWGEAFSAKRGEALALFFPRPFESSVRPQSMVHRVDPHFTWAIMKNESTFRPELISAANARGLMQLVPATAAEVAKALGQPPPDPDALFSPALNVRLGTWYLGKLLERFGHPVACAASYNAGPSAAARWLDEHGKQPLDLFVELISYRETRGYVKQVLADLAVYQALYEHQGVLPPLELTLPAYRPGVSF